MQMSPCPQVRSSLQTKAKQTVREPHRREKSTKLSTWWWTFDDGVNTHVSLVEQFQLSIFFPPASHRSENRDTCHTEKVDDGSLYWMFGLKNATLWTFYTLDFFKKVYHGSITLLAPGTTCDYQGCYILRKIADLLSLSFTFPGYWEGDTPKVQQRSLFGTVRGWSFFLRCYPSTVSFFVIAFSWIFTEIYGS